MEIYLVQEGDTIESISLKFGISAERLATDNGINEPQSLVIGQALVIPHPSQVYTVKDGDTLEGIADNFQVPVLQLLRNNPELAAREYLYPGETLVISYNNTMGYLLIAGYAYPYINKQTLAMTLPSLTYIPIFNYRLGRNGELLGSDEDIPVIETAKAYGVAPILVVTAFSETGDIDVDVVFDFLLNVQAQNTLIETLLSIVEAKGYAGVNLAYQLINTSNQQLFLDFLINVANSFHSAGYPVFLTLNPGLSYNGTEVTFEQIDYTDFGRIADGILFLSYNWGSTERPPIQFSIVTTKSLLDYIVSQVPLEKIRIGLPTVAYNWQLPYIEGETKANALNYDSVLSLASQMDAVINFDETTLSAYFEYVDNEGNQHIVWFKDARSIDGSLKILQSYGIEGIGLWNIMYYFHPLWLVVNTQYEIRKLS